MHADGDGFENLRFASQASVAAEYWPLLPVFSDATYQLAVRSITEHFVVFCSRTTRSAHRLDGALESRQFQAITKT
jgi:hypothetical protein